ncbi:(2Fe-2S)-binding protein [Actinokineospora inagensis]|uniref:(2Fe-2S)-binding protein n=1 Tax=Actinokineospora inagensis TaxID=103730 RepID=UPI00040E0B8E|nr:(2Fe-2S)-binding protein [Actinokineospora inagensis]
MTEQATENRTAIPVTARVSLRVNGVEHHLVVEPRMTLLDALREVIGLTGTKKGCDRGECGACTVHVDGRRVNACLTLAVMQDGHDVTTVEGLGTPENPHPVQRAFVANDALQCGFCTPGQVMAAAACIAEGNATAPHRIREWMSGNLCRCAAYPQIIAAIQEAAQADPVDPAHAR